MYCSKCGNPINETDLNCRICGAEVNGRSDENAVPAGGREDAAESGKAADETAAGDKPVRHMEFTWNVYDFPKPKKTEDLNLYWTLEDERRRQAEAEAEKQREAERETQPVKESGDGVEGETEQTRKPEAGNAQEPARDIRLSAAEGTGVSGGEQSAGKKAEAEAARKESVREIEKFFTFTKKNEEFQQLLDREYDKLKRREQGEPYVEPDLSFEREEEDVYLRPDVSEAQSEFERMILEGTTPAEEAVPVEDLFRRRTMPVDLTEIQKEARRAAERRDAETAPPQESRGEAGERAAEPASHTEIPTETEGKQREPETPAEAEEPAPSFTEESGIPSIELQKKSVDEIVRRYTTALGADEIAAAAAAAALENEFRTEPSTHEVQRETAEEAAPAESEGTTAAESSSDTDDTDETTETAVSAESKAAPSGALARELAEMAAARDRMIQQLAEEKEALKRAEAEAARREKEEQERQAADLLRHAAEPYPQPQPETLTRQTLPGANAEIQVTVAVKAGGSAPGETVSVISGPAGSEVYRTAVASEPAPGGRPVTAYIKESAGTTSSDTRRYEPPAELTMRTRVVEAKEVRAAAQAGAQARPPVGFGQASAPDPAAAPDMAPAYVPAPDPASAPDRKSEDGGQAGIKADQKGPEPAARPAAMEEPWHENTLNSLFAVVPESEEQKEEEKKGGRGGKIILTIIAVILVIEIAALGIKYFAPESAAADAVRSVEVRIVQIFSGAVEGVSDFFKGLSGDDDPVPGGDADGDGSAEGTAGTGEENGSADLDGTADGEKPDPAPMSDKTALIASQSSKNKNIKEISASDELKYLSGQRYKTKDIENSKPLENNIWKTLPSGETLYYDQAVVGTIIAFDSQWQDYVNSGTKDALSLLKEGSQAYRYASTYSRVGKETQSFELLQIGEIRQGENGFYVWTKEQIKKTQSGQTKIVTYHWIYQLEPVGDEMKIVNYTRYEV